ncbi:hypothetical protein [Botrimarina sp.]|uniref:hypothetical protein n=1 Tax=Botrimarina sp. TaxID=2795802 RepID=UPI0032EDE795
MKSLLRCGIDRWRYVLAVTLLAVAPPHKPALADAIDAVFVGPQVGGVLVDEGVGSWWDDANWSNFQRPDDTQAETADDTARFDAALLQTGAPRHVVFGDFDKRVASGGGSSFVPGGVATVQELHLEQGAWTFDFDYFDDPAYFGVNAEPAAGGLVVTGFARVAGELTLEGDGVFTTAEASVGWDGPGAVTVSGPGTVWDVSPDAPAFDLWIGDGFGQSDTGAVRIENGGLLRGGYLGMSPGSDSMLEVVGAGSAVEAFGLEIGLDPQLNAVATFSEGGALRVDYAWLGRGDSVGTLSVQGSQTVAAMFELAVGGTTRFDRSPNEGTGVVTVGDGGRVFVGDGLYLYERGKIEMGAGGLAVGAYYDPPEPLPDLAPGVVRILPPGQLVAVGRIEGDLSNEGRLVLSDVDPGTLDVASSPGVAAGDFTQTPDGELEVLVAGGGANDASRLVVEGTAQLAGALVVVLRQGTRPLTSTVHTILESGSLISHFDNVADGGRVATADSEGSFAVGYDAASAAVTLSDFAFDPTLAGDYTRDGVVDAADYTLWRDHVGGDNNWLGGNGDDAGASSGVVDHSDYGYWASRYGQLEGSRATPEPAGAVLLACVATAGGSGHRGRRSP